jgi:hypothetical protein
MANDLPILLETGVFHGIFKPRKEAEADVVILVQSKSASSVWGFVSPGRCSGRVYSILLTTGIVSSSSRGLSRGLWYLILVFILRG